MGAVSFAESFACFCDDLLIDGGEISIFNRKGKTRFLPYRLNDPKKASLSKATIRLIRKRNNQAKFSF